jgi:4'-phosphopantetheinyl transferase
MDTLVYTADITALDDPAVFEKLLGTVPAYRREKAMRFKFPSGRAQSLGVGLLLRLACREAGIAGADENVVLGENGKPSFRDVPDVHFNLSHSKTRVMCVISPCEVGCDVEYVRVGRWRLAERFFKESETRWIHSFPEGEEQDEAFCRLWTLKECYMKVTGRGMALSPDKFTLSVTSEGILLDHDGPRPEYAFREISRNDGFRYAFCLKGAPANHTIVEKDIAFDASVQEQILRGDS